MFQVVARGLLAATVVASTVVVWADVFNLPSGLTSLETVTVGNPGNANDSSTGFGAVGYTYQMGKYEVTNAQYCQFLNAKLPTISDPDIDTAPPIGDPFASYNNTLLPSDTYGLYSRSMEAQVYGGINYDPAGAMGAKFSVKLGYENRPVNYVSWYDSVRFANWLQNGQGSGSTENGTYMITGSAQNSGNVSVPDATTRAAWTPANPHWVLPSANEWYKAAYHKNDGVTGNYWGFPAGTNDVPVNVLSDPDPGNNANFQDFFDTGTGGYTTISPYLTNVGTFKNSDSPYGTFDQGGNVREWNEAWISVDSWAGLRGGAFESSEVFLAASPPAWFGCASLDGSPSIGFRVANVVPEPGSMTLLLAGAISILACARRRRTRRAGGTAGGE